MRKFNEKRAWFYVKHKGLAQLTGASVMVALYTAALYLLGAGVTTILIVDVVLVLFSLLSGMGASGALMKEPLERFNNGEPEPLLQVTEELLKYAKNDVNRIVITINCCAALSDMGEHRRVIEILEDLNVDGNVSVPLNIKYIYYNNLADAHYSAGNYAQGEMWYQRCAKVFESIKNKAPHENHFIIATAQYYLYGGKYEKAMATLCGIKPETDKNRAVVAFLSGKVNMALGDTEQAKKDFMFVKSYGKNIDIVQKASVILEDMNKETVNN